VAGILGGSPAGPAPGVGSSAMEGTFVVEMVRTTLGPGRGTAEGEGRSGQGAHPGGGVGG
jgi:hypothetical protein